MKFKLIVQFLFLGMASVYSQNLEKDFEKLNTRMLNGEYVDNTEFTKLLNSYSNKLESHPDESAKLFYYIGGNLYHDKKVDEATESYSKAYNYSLKAKDTTLKYIIILSFARVSHDLKNYTKAEEYYLYALPGMAAIYGASNIEYTRIYFEYVKLLLDMDRLADAKPLLDGLEYYFKTLNLLNDPTYIAVLGNQAYILQETGNYKEALEKYNYLLEDHRILKSGDTLGFIITISNLGETYREMGDYDRSISNLQSAKRYMRQFNLNSPEQAATIENNLGLLYKTLDDYKNSEESFGNAIRIYQEAKLDNSEPYCSTLSNKADLLRLLGRKEEGLKLLTIALKTREMNFGTNSENYANALSNYGLIAFELDYNDIALEYFEEALKIYEKTIAKTHQSYANCLNNLADCYFNKHDYKKAEALKFEAIKIIENTLGKEHFKYISFTIGATEMLIESKNYDKALRFLNEAKALSKKKFGVNHDLYIRSLISLAYLKSLMNNYEESLRDYEEGIDRKMNSLNSFFYIMNREDQVVYLQEIQGEMMAYSTTLFYYSEHNPKVEMDSHNEKYFNYNLLLKSLLNKNSTEWQREIEQAEDKDLRGEYQKWLRLKNALNDLYKSDFTAAEQDSLHNKINYLETYLKKSINYKQEPMSSFKSLKALLQPNEAIIDISWYMSALNDTNAVAKYAALIIEENSTFPKCTFLSKNNIEEEECIGNYNERMESEVLDTLSYKLFYQNLVPFLKGKSKLYVSSKGAYSRINFQTLYNTETKRYLIEDIDIVYLPNLSTLNSVGEKGNANNTAELFGNPDFNFDFRRNTTKTVMAKQEFLAKRFGLTEIKDLPGTENELNNIERLLKTNKWNVNAFKRDQANEENLRKVISPKLLHIATHGYFLKEVETTDSKFLGFNSKVFEQLADVQSGLILAGAAVSTNDTVQISADKDGILTSREASVLNLSKTDLVVLSACQTGLGQETLNMGVIGLQQAFSNAGAKNLILSLWPVDDNATQLLMTKFYENWLKEPTNQNISMAFKKAQLDVKIEYPHPYYWGAFILIKN